jgi:dihydrofolate reductase
LDGVIEAPETWHFPYLSDDMQAFINEAINTADAFLYGRVTYAGFASFWPTQTENEFGIADKLNNTPKYVVSTTLDKAEWNNATLIKGNLDTEINKLKQQIAGTIAMTGSANLIQSLMEYGLVDEFQLLVHPIVVGNGKRLFNDGVKTTGLKLTASQTFSSGVIVLTYQPDTQA